MYRQIILTFLLALLSWTGWAQGTQPFTSYLMVYHKDQDHGLHMAVSDDGYTWTALNNDRPVIGGDTIAEQHGIRDPHIFRGPDGAFYLSMTDLHVFGRRDGYRTTEWERDGKRYGWGNNRGLVLMKSNDLINWTRTNIDFSRLPAQEGMNWQEVGCVWAPETVYDEESKQLMIHFTTREGNGKNIICYAYVNSDFNALTGQPQLLAEAPGRAYNIIDSDIIRVGDTYHLFYVSHEGGATPKHATSKKLTGPYTFDDYYSDGERQGHEAPNCWQRLGTDTYVVMFDNFRRRPMNFGFVETKDFVNYKPIGYFDAPGCPMKRTNFSEQKHGAVTYLTAEEARRLRRHWRNARKDVPIDSIRLSDPAVLADPKTNIYYMTGTGGQMWRSRDLKLWEGPFRVTDFKAGSWMGPRPMIWAAELHQTGDGYYYYFATFTNQAVKIDTVKGNVIERRASQVLRADNPMGPYRAFGDETYLPADRPTLDGTFWQDTDGKPYMVFCGEWLQNWNGTIEKIELKPDLSGTVGEPKVLFRASDSPWSREKDEQGNVTWNKVTDGPWLFRTGTGRLGMLWTSWIYDVYTQGVAYSASGTLDGPWIQEPEPITPPGFGHSMLFQRFDGQWMMSVHHHSRDALGRTVRIPHFFEVDLSGDKLVVKMTDER